MLYTFPDSLAYDQKLQDTDLAYLFSSEKALGSPAGVMVCKKPKLGNAPKNQRLARGSSLQVFVVSGSISHAGG